MSGRERLQAVPTVDDPVHHPSHYFRGGIECREVERALLGDSCVHGIHALLWMDALEYLWRWDKKGGVQDLRKARECIDSLIEEVEGA